MILTCVLIYLLLGVLIGCATHNYYHRIMYERHINDEEYQDVSPELLSKLITLVLLIMSMCFWPVWLFYSVKRIFV